MYNYYSGSDYFDDVDTLMGMGTAGYVMYLLVAAFIIVCLWKIFTKAHEEGWAAIVPFYRFYVLFKITWGKGWNFLLMLIPIANAIIGIITMVKLAKAFGKGGGFACGLIFLPIVFLPIMAFSNDIQYVGIPGKTNGGMDYGPGSGRAWQDPYQQPNGYGYANQNTYQQQSAQNPNYHYQRTETSNPASGGYCPRCGAPVEAGSRFCASCGNQL